MLVKDIAEKWGAPDKEIRFIFGNVLVGDQVTLETPVGREVGAIAALEENRKRRFLFFLRPGFSCDSKARVFVSNWLPFLPRHLDTSINGEHRPCIQCSYCEDVCPRPLLPHLLQKYCTHQAIDKATQKPFYDMLEDAKNLRLMGCIECGLCTYVCPSKLPIMTDIQKGKAQLQKEGLV